MIRFARHAEDKLEERRIPKRLVLAALAHPDFIRPSYGNREIAFKKFGRKHLAVIFAREVEALVVITQYWISNNL